MVIVFNERQYNGLYHIKSQRLKPRQYFQSESFSASLGRSRANAADKSAEISRLTETFLEKTTLEHIGCVKSMEVN